MPAPVSAKTMLLYWDNGSNRADWSNRSKRDNGPNRTDRSKRGNRPNRTDRSERSNRSNGSDRPERDNRPNRCDRSNRPYRPHGSHWKRWGRRCYWRYRNSGYVAGRFCDHR